MGVEHENSAKSDLGTWQARGGEEQAKDFETSKSSTDGIDVICQRTPPRIVVMLRLPHQTHHGVSLAPVLLALVWIMRTRIGTVSEGGDDDECLSLDLAELQRTP